MHTDRQQNQVGERATPRAKSQFLRQKFSTGLKGLPYSASYRLDRLLGLHVASIGSSHFCSTVDIVLGSLRFVINNRNDATRQDACRTLLAQLAPIASRNAAGKVEEISVFFSPIGIRVPAYLSHTSTSTHTSPRTDSIASKYHNQNERGCAVTEPCPLSTYREGV